MTACIIQRASLLDFLFFQLVQQLLMLFHPLLELLLLNFQLLLLSCICIIHFLQDPEEEAKVDAYP